MQSQHSDKSLRRTLSLTQMVLYGLGTTVGAGIYALIGEIADVAGYAAPWSFLLAATLAGFTAISFAHLSARFPRAAGAALYVENGLGSARLAALVGLLVIAAGTVSSAALLNGFVGYLGEFIQIPRSAAIIVTALILVLVATWGIAESVWLAGLVSVVEVAGLLWVSWLCADSLDLSAVQFSVLSFDWSPASLTMVTGGAILAFYAFIGFEDMVEVAEEVSDVSTTLPRAIILTLVLSTLIYLMLVVSALLAVGPDRLAASSAPLADIYRAVTGGNPAIISAIGLFAIINGALIQIIMASRVLYGLASRGQLPKMLGYVHMRTRTPWVATMVAGLITISLALSGSLNILAELTSVVMLTVFTLVNVSLFMLSLSSHPLRAAIAGIGALTCAGFALRSMLGWLG